MYSDLKELDIYKLEEIIQRYPWYVNARVALLDKLARMGREYFESGVRASFIYLPNRKVILRRIMAEIPSLDPSADKSVVPAAHITPTIDEVAAVNEELEINERETILSETSEVESDLADRFEIAEKEKTELPTDKPEFERNDIRESETEEIDFNIVMEEIRRTPDENRRPKPGVSKPYILGGDYFSSEDFKELERGKVNLVEDKQVDFKYTEFREERESNADSVFRDIGLYTETLAQIYAQQGYYQQAIEVYSKLSLLYPEKSAYFASLVQEIKLKK
jgi:tetratricopeptide (TPR) repeat protein